MLKSFAAIDLAAAAVGPDDNSSSTTTATTSRLPLPPRPSSQGPNHHPRRPRPLRASHAQLGADEVIIPEYEGGLMTGRMISEHYPVLTNLERWGETKAPFSPGASGKMITMDYLLKTEPSEYSFADLERDQRTVWDGVSNPVALKNLRAMKPGDRLVIYETGDHKSAVGTATVVSAEISDARNPQVKIKAGKALGSAVTLAEVKANKLFADSPLVRQGRLSVVPLTEKQYAFLAGS